MTIRIGNAPCSWGVEFADDPRNPDWKTVLKECAGAGYKGIELGPVGFMPEDPAIVSDALAENDLELIGGVVSEHSMIRSNGKMCKTVRCGHVRHWLPMARSIWC